MRLGPNTPGDYVRAWVLVPRNPGVTSTLAPCYTPLDEDITAINTPHQRPPSPFSHGPVKRVRARKFNYQVNSFLVVEANSSLNEVLKPCDDFIMLRCLGGEPSWTREGNKAIKAAAPERIS